MSIVDNVPGSTAAGTTSPGTTGPGRGPALTRIDLEHIPSLTRGAAILGTGGGGDPYIGGLLAKAAINEYGPVEITQLADLPDDAVVVPVAMLGAPTVMVEKLADLENLNKVVEMIAAFRGKRATHIACIEIGGINSTMPIVTAARMGLPLVDGDGMGRAFPEVQMVLPNLAGIAATPMSVVDEKGNSLLIDAVDGRWAERLARTAAVEMGCSVMTSSYSMTGREARGSFVDGSISTCVHLGDVVSRSRHESGDPASALAGALGGRLIHEGKLVDVERKTQTGFARGVATIDGTGESAGTTLVLNFQNENLMAVLDGAVVTTTPDLIIVVDAETAEPITTETLRYGQRVRVITAPSDPRWHSATGIAVAGPGYFGYDSPATRWDGSETVTA